MSDTEGKFALLMCWWMFLSGLFVFHQMHWNIYEDFFGSFYIFFFFFPGSIGVIVDIAFRIEGVIR